MEGFGPAACVSDCPLTLTTTFTPPKTCSDYWTPVTTYADPSSPEAVSIQFTQYSTKAECLPSGLADCISCNGGALVFGVCPGGWPAASVGIVQDMTTYYCCPS